MLPDEIDPMVKLVIRSHHENQDGTGYPEGIPGDRINIFARVIRVADAYAAATATKVYQQAKSSLQVLYEMLYGPYQSFYDPTILKVFASVTQPLPIGAKLKLESGHWAVVVRHNRHNPFAPEIIMAFDEWGDPLGQEELQSPFFLGERDDVKVVSFADEDISFLNGLSEPPGMPAPQQVAQSFSEVFDFAYP